MLLYVDGPELRLTPYDRILVNAEIFNGPILEALEPHRLFPVSGLTKYIALMDEEGAVQCIIRDVEKLLPETGKVLQDSLNEYYMVPKILQIISRSEKYGIWKWTVETDHGILTFEMVDIINSIKRLFDNRILIIDADDNRYEIPDLNKLDSHSKRLLMPDI